MRIDGGANVTKGGSGICNEDKAGDRLNGQELAATGIVVSPHCRGRTRTNVTPAYGSGGED